MASGLGKTLVAAFDFRRYERDFAGGARFLYLSERRVILQQAEERFRWVLGNERTFGRFYEADRDLDAELVFASFQSLHPVVAGIARDRFDYIVVDEAHHTAAPTHATVLERLRPRFLLGLTATPFRGDGQDIRQFYGDEVPVSLPLERALARDLLTPIEYHVISDAVDESVLERTLQVSARGLPGSGFVPRNDESIVETVYRQANVIDKQRRIVVFCASLDQMRHFARLFPRSETISSENSAREQSDLLERFEAGAFEVLLSRDVLNEGADMPNASTLVFLRNTESPVVFLQQLGRGLRRVTGKERVIVLDFVNNVERIEFVYGFYSRLRSEQERLRSRALPQAPESALHLDVTARDVVRVLLARKRAAQLVVDQEGLQAAFDYKLGPATVRRMVADGRLVPDFITPDGREMLFERHTYEAFFRQVHSAAGVHGLIADRELARAMRRPTADLRRAQERGELAAAWIHARPNGVLELLFEATDVENPYRSY